MKKFHLVSRIVLLLAIVVSVSAAGIAPVLAGSDGKTGRAVNKYSEVSCVKESASAASPEKELLSDEEMNDLNGITSQSNSLGSQVAGDADFYIHGEEVVVILLAILLVLLILVIIW